LLRGNHPAKVDEKGRIKIPNGFLQLIESRYGPDVFVTSLTGENVWVYPMEVWLELERKLESVPDRLPAKARFLDRIAYFGQAGSIDKQGRLLIPAQLRETAEMVGDVAVLGKSQFVEIWNRGRFLEKLSREPFSDEDARVLAEYGI
jgi:MraZ protein